VPEGPEVETVRRSLQDRVVGATLGAAWVSPLRLRTPVSRGDLAFLDGARVTSLGRKGKTLVLAVENDRGVFVRLGMTGRLLVVEQSMPAPPHTHVRVPLSGTANELRFIDPRRFGEFVPWSSRQECDAVLGRLGPDGLSLSNDDRGAVAAALRATRRSIKDALLDQTVVAGVGNIYAAEACFVARLSPTRPGHTLRLTEARRLVTAIEEVLAQGVENRGTSFSDYVDGDGRRGDNASRLWVFGREGEPCRSCGAVVQRIVQGARSTFLCPRCQRSSWARTRPVCAQKRKAAPAAT
jgi:formamidopyrimidine-DNA glycosylase